MSLCCYQVVIKDKTSLLRTINMVVEVELGEDFAVFLKKSLKQM